MTCCSIYAENNVTQESQLVVVHNELNAVNLQGLCILLQTNRQEVGYRKTLESRPWAIQYMK